MRRANSEAQIAFLRGYFELECHVNDGRCIEVVSASGLLLQQIRLMLLNLGITSTISENTSQVIKHILPAVIQWL